MGVRFYVIVGDEDAEQKTCGVGCGRRAGPGPGVSLSIQAGASDPAGLAFSCWPLAGRLLARRAASGR
jgi:hypothetical protein